MVIEQLLFTRPFIYLYHLYLTLYYLHYSIPNCGN